MKNPTSPSGPRVVFFGNEQLASGVSLPQAPLLTGLLALGYDVVAVINAQAGQRRSRKAAAQPVQDLAAAHGIPVLAPANKAGLADMVANLQADVGVLAAFGMIIPQSVIDHFPAGIVNLHPSLLPLHRGPTPIEATILAGDPQAGVSIMQLTAGMDEGPVFGQAKLSLDDSETTPELAVKLGQLGYAMLLRLLPHIISGQLQPKAQNGQASYSTMLSKDDADVATAPSAQAAQRQVRAYAGWPGSRAELYGVPVTILEAHIAPVASAAEPHLRYGSEALVITKLRPDGKNTMSAADFVRGYKKKAND